VSRAELITQVVALCEKWGAKLTMREVRR